MSEQIVVIRVRGTNNTIEDVARTLSQLRLPKVNHATIIESTPSYLGMLQRAKDYVAWGPISKEALVTLITKRGRPKSYKDTIIKDRRLSDALIKKHTSYATIERLADAILNGETKLTDILCIKPVFRLHPSGLRPLHRRRPQPRPCPARMAGGQPSAARHVSRSALTCPWGLPPPRVYERALDRDRRGLREDRQFPGLPGRRKP